MTNTTTITYKPAGELKADEDELLLLADKVPEAISKRIREHPEAFRMFAALNDAEMDRFFETAIIAAACSFVLDLALSCQLSHKSCEVLPCSTSLW